MQTILPATPPQTSQNATDFTDPVAIASYLELAAARIKAHGKSELEWWKVIDPTTGLPELNGDFRDGSPTDVLGAIAVELGHRTNRGVFETVCGLNDEADGADRQQPHPVVRELMGRLGFTKVEQLWEWSDSLRDDQVVDQLRVIAAGVRSVAS